ERGAVGLVAQGLDREAGAVVEHGHVLVSLGALLLRRHEPVVLVVATGGEAEENGDGGEVHDEEEVLVEAGTGTAHAAAPHCSVFGYTVAGTNTRRSIRRHRFGLAGVTDSTHASAHFGFRRSRAARAHASV